MKKITAFLLLTSLIMTLFTVSGGIKAEGVSEDKGKILTVYCRNDEIVNLIYECYRPPAGIELEFVVTPDDNSYYSSYYSKLLSDLKKQSGDKPIKEPIDIFLTEVDSPEMVST